MPIYDYRCTKCGHETFDVFESSVAPFRICEQSQELTHGQKVVCAGQLERVWHAKSGGVISDECDVWVKHGICNEDGSPRHYTSKAEMARVAAERGLVNHVEHIPSPGSDKNKHGHTTRWV